jgi:hypothetical protein
MCVGKAFSGRGRVFFKNMRIDLDCQLREVYVGVSWNILSKFRVHIESYI